MEYEIVIGNGEVLTVSSEKNPELFYGTACSYGSLGIITLAKIRIVPAKDFVHLTYHMVKSFKEAVSLIEGKVTTDTQFIDAILFEKSRGVIMTGNFSDKNNLPESTFKKRSDEWFYLHADKISKKYSTYEEIIPIRDYLFRYDRGAFWMGKYGFKFLKIPFCKFTRFILDSMFNTRNIYQMGHTVNIMQEYFIQDICVPIENTFEFLELVDNELCIYPLWLLPLQPEIHSKLSPTYLNTKLIIDVGIWGEVKNKTSDLLLINRNFENILQNLKGRKVLYAHQYYLPEEFWGIYDEAWYKTLRSKYFADSVFPDLYDKTKVTEEYKKSVWRGLWRNTKFFIKTIFS